MDKQQLTGYEAEVWIRDKNLNKDTFVAAGFLFECKAYMKMVAEKETADRYYYILSGESKIVWNFVSQEWNTLPESHEILKYREKIVEAFEEAKRIAHDSNIKGYTSLAELKVGLEKDEA